MAHCTHSIDHLRLLQERGTSVAHCPLSNVYFSPEATFPLVEARHLGINVGLGSDISGGYRLGLDEQMRQAVNVSKLRRQAREYPNDESIDWKQSLYHATLGGARAMGLQSGKFEVGRPFDAQIIDLGRDPSAECEIDWFDAFDNETLENMVERWWCNGTTRNRLSTWVQGQQVFCNRK